MSVVARDERAVQRGRATTVARRASTPPTISRCVAGHAQTRDRARRAASRGTPRPARELREVGQRLRRPAAAVDEQPGRCRRPRAPAMSVTGSSPTCTQRSAVDSEPLEGDPERRGSGFAAPTAAAVTIDLRSGSARPSRASTSGSETSQLAITASRTPAATSAIERGQGVVVGVESDGVGERRAGARRPETSTASASASSEAHSSRSAASEAASCARCSGRGSGASRRACRASQRARSTSRPSRRSSERCRRGAGGSMRDERAHRVERDRREARHCLTTVGCSECASERMSA